MQPNSILKTLAVGLAASTLLVACKSKEGSDNPDVAAGYRGEDHNQYESDIVTAEKRHEYADQGKGIKPKTLANIEDTITNVYEKDFERCLETVMDEEETRFVRSGFIVEFTIGTDGIASKARVLEIITRKQDAKGTDIGDVTSSTMKDCISESIKEWEFEPAPEVNYVHTYRGSVGEAF